MKPFQKNARMLFTGCSITGHSNYTLRIADYYRKNLPHLNVKFFGCCQAGGSLSHAIKHFDSMITPFEPTHVTFMYGGNDCGLGILNRPDGEEKEQKLRESAEAYKRNLETFTEMLQKRNITPTFITPTPHGEFMQIDSPAYPCGQKRTAEFAEIMRLCAIKRGVEYSDFHARLSELYTHEDIFCRDRVHPTDFGHYRMAQKFLRDQGLDIGEYVTHEELLKDEWNAAWFKNVYRLSRIYAAYVNIPQQCNYELPYEEQMHTVEEYVLNHGYGTSNAARDFSTEFVIFKPIEKTFIENQRRLNGDEI